MGIWSISSNINGGYPFNSDLQGVEYQEGFIGDIPHNIWRITSGINDGYPYIGYYIDISELGGDMNLFPDGSGGSGGTGQETDTGNFTTVINTGSITGGTMYYSLSSSTVNNLISWLNTTYNPQDETQFIQDFKGQNPSDYITTIKYFPFDVPSVTPGRTITIGKLSTGFTGGELRNEYGTSWTFIDMGSLAIDRYYNDFRDFITKICVVIPYCGITEIDPKTFYGHILKVKLSVDFVTGNCCAFLYRDDMIIDTINGSCATDISLSAINQGSYQNAIAVQKQALDMNTYSIYGSLAGMVGSGIGAAIGLGTGNVVAGVGGLIGMGTSLMSGLKTTQQNENINYNIEHTAPTKTNISSASPFNNLLNEFNARVIFYRPKTLPNINFDIYRDNIGYASCIPDKIGNYNGFTVVSNADLSGISATTSEISMIKSALERGIYI